MSVFRSTGGNGRPSQRQPWHTRLASSAARVTVAALEDSLRAGHMDELDGHLERVLDAIDQRGVENLTKGEGFLLAAEAARALGRMEQSEAIARRIASMQGSNLLDLIAASERLRARLLLDRGAIAAAREMALQIDRLILVRPHAQNIVSPESDGVSARTHLLAAEIELMDGNIAGAAAAVERAAQRVRSAEQDEAGADDIAFLNLLRAMILSCQDHQMTARALGQLADEWRDTDALSAATRARLTIVRGHWHGDAPPPGINQHECGRWMRVGDDMRRGIYAVKESPVIIVEEAEEAAPATGMKDEAAPPKISDQIFTPSAHAAPKVAVEQEVSPRDFAVLPDDDNLLSEFDRLLDETLDSQRLDLTSRTSDVLNLAEAPFHAPVAAGVAMADLEDARTVLTTAPLVLPPKIALPQTQSALGEMIVRLDIMSFELVIQGLERETNTGRLELTFDEGVVETAIKDGANFDHIEAASQIEGGVIYFRKGLIIDAELRRRAQAERQVAAMDALVLLVNIAVGCGAGVQVCFIRGGDERERAFGAANNTGLLLSILSATDEQAGGFNSTPADVLSFDASGPGFATGMSFEADAGQIAARDILNIMTAERPEELCILLAAAIKAQRLALRYSDEVIAAAGEDDCDGPEQELALGPFTFSAIFADATGGSMADPRTRALIEATRMRLLAMPRVERQSDFMPQQYDLGDDIVAASKSMTSLFSVVHKLALLDGLSMPFAHILVTGESGTGKELIAKMIHKCSGRSAARFLTVNSGVLSNDLAAAEIFGCKKGAFTGADADRPGYIDAAKGGTIFLDEIANASERVQAMLLRIIEYGEYQRLGDPQPRESDARFVLATNKNIDDPAVFKMDLKHRLQVIEVPPLRARRDDIRPLANLFARRHKVTLAESAYLWLERQDWPGNVRELAAFIQFAASQSDAGATLNMETLRELLATRGQYNAPLPPLLAGETFDEAVARIERGYVELVIGQNPGNLNQAARLYGVARTTLVGKAKKYGIISGE